MTTRRHGLINARIPDIEWETPHLVYRVVGPPLDKNTPRSERLR